MRIILDTVVLVRGLLDPFGWSGRLLFDRTAAYKWVISPAVVDEYLEVTKRPELVRKFRSASGRDLNAILDRLESATLVQPSHVPEVCRDPGDDKFLAAALAGSAAFIVTEDLDLLDLGVYEGIPIVTAEAFLRILDAQADAEP